MKRIIALVLILILALALCAVSALAEDYVIATDTAFRPFEFADESGAMIGRLEPA